MNKLKRLVGVFSFAGIMTLNLTASETQAEQKIVVDESEMIVTNNCSVGTIFDYVDKYSVRLEKSAPSIVSLDNDFSYNYVVSAKEKLKKVVIEDQIPAGATYVSSSPNAEVKEGAITWTLYNLEEGETVPLELVVKTSEVSDLSNCATVIAYPQACTAVSVGVPELVVEMATIIDNVLLNSDVLWNITVTNTGSYCAEDVVLTNTLPEGLSHSSGDNSQIISIGSLAPGESREVNLDTTAVEPGKLCNVTVATASNAEPAEAESCIVALKSGIEVMVDGPEEEYVGKPVTYTINVSNTGDIPFEDIAVTDTVTLEGKILAAEGAQIEDNTALWMVNLAPGEEKEFTLDLIVFTKGKFCNEVSVSTPDLSINESDNACTQWNGYPALLIEVIDTQDPVIVGEETTYIVQVANQGSGDDTNVELQVQIPEGLTVLSISGDTGGKIAKNSIKFDPYPVLKAKEIIQYRVLTKAVETGDLRFKASLNSDLLGVPVPEEESTQVY